MKLEIRRCVLTSWNDWFAWHPVRIGDAWHWLERVSRRGTRILIANGDGMPEEVWQWEYREPK